VNIYAKESNGAEKRFSLNIRRAEIADLLMQYANRCLDKALKRDPIRGVPEH